MTWFMPNVQDIVPVLIDFLLTFKFFNQNRNDVIDSKTLTEAQIDRTISEIYSYIYTHIYSGFS